MNTMDELNKSDHNFLSTDEEDENFLNFVLKSGVDLEPQRKEDTKKKTSHSLKKDILLCNVSTSSADYLNTSCFMGSEMGTSEENVNSIVAKPLDGHTEFYDKVNKGLDFSEISTVCSNVDGTSDIAVKSNDATKSNDMINNNVNEDNSTTHELYNCNLATSTCNKYLPITDSDLDHISPELFCLSHMSPTEIYGKDHTVEYQRLYSRNTSSRSDSTLNTPDPIVFDDSNSMNMFYASKYVKDENENPISDFDTDLNNNVEDNSEPRGTKRKFKDTNIEDHVKGSISDAAITSIINQGRPPDISTWRAVSSSRDLQGSYQEDQNSQWNKPRCIVTPFHTTQMPSCSQPVDNYSSGHQEQMYASNAGGHFNTASNMSLMPQQPYIAGNQYLNGTGIVKSANQLIHNTASCNSYQPNMHNTDYRYQAAYRLDFSSPANFGDTQGVVNFVSHPPYHSVGLARPRAMHPSHMNNLNPGYLLDIGSSANLLPENYRNCASANSGLNSTSTTPELLETIHSHSKLKQAPQIQTNKLDTAQCFKPVNTNDVGCRVPAKENPVADLTCTKKEELDKKDVNNNLVPDSCFKHLKVDIYYDELKIDLQDIAKRSKADNLNDKERSNGVKNGTDESVNSTETDTSTNDLTYDKVGEKLGEESDCESDKTSNTGQSATSDTFAKVQNKYFTEIYLKARRSRSPVTSFCKALDLSKRQPQEEKGTPKTKTILPKSPPYGQPQVPISSILNSASVPTLAYSHGMLVPYMNSIFAAMANVKTVPPQNTFGAVFDNGWNSQQNVSVLTGGRDPILNQHSTLYSSGIDVSSNRIAPIPSVVNFTPPTGLYTAVPSSMPMELKVNVNQYPLPLYSNSVQYPIRPLVTNNFSIAADGQRIQNPFLYRYNIGLPMPGIATTLVTPSVPAANVNNNTVQVQDAGIKQGSTSVGLMQGTVNSACPTAGGIVMQKCATVKREVPGPVASTVNPLVAQPISIDEVCNMSLQGNKYTSPVHTQTRGLTTYQPAPLRGFYCDKQKPFKAKHYIFCTLQIGSYTFKCNPTNTEKVARVKILFSKKRFVYEFQLDGPRGDMKAFEDMVCIEVPFYTIVGLWLFKKDMRLEVNQTPKIFLGKKSATRKTAYVANLPMYNNKVCVDITQGQLGTVPYHYIQFKQNYADKIKTELRQFDPRFETLLSSPLVEDPAKSLKPATRNIQSRLLDPTIHLPDENVKDKNIEAVYRPDEHHIVTQSVLCCCTNGCSTRTCQCCVTGTTCTEGVCTCDNCRNPLNILYQLGLPSDRARTDPCLMENIYKIRRLDYYLKTQVTLECCKVQVLLLNCIPGLVQCPYCPAQYRYSWCFAQACHEQTRPRNHCIKCGRCSDHRNAHCKRCNICYFAGDDKSFPCPACERRKMLQNVESGRRVSHFQNINSGLEESRARNIDAGSKESHNQSGQIELNPMNDDSNPGIQGGDADHGCSELHSDDIKPSLTSNPGVTS